MRETLAQLRREFVTALGTCSHLRIRMSVTGGLLRSSLLVFDVFPLADLSVSRLHLKLIPILVGVFCLAGWAEQPAAPEGAAVA